MNAADQNIAQNTTEADMALLDGLLSGGGAGADAGAALDLELDLALDAGADVSDDALLSSLLSTPEALTPDAEIEPPVTTAAAADDDLLDLDLDESALLAAAASAEGVESVADLPAQAAASTEAPAAAADAEVAKPEKKASAPKKAPTTARTTYTNSKASEVLKSRLGGSVADDLVLEVADADLTPEQLQAKQQELLDILNVRPRQSADGSTQKKVAEKVVLLFSYLKTGGKLNEVLNRTFRVLVKDGYVQMGKQGNLFADLLAKPYSVGTANAQGGQMMQMLPLLKIALPDASNKGRLVVNPDSVILMRMVQMLGLDKTAA